MQIFTFFSPDFKENFIFNEFVLLYSPFRLEYDHFYIGQTPVEEGYDLVITKDKVKIYDQKVIIIEENDQNEIEKSTLIYKKIKNYIFTCNLNENLILMNGNLINLDKIINNSQLPSSKSPSNSLTPSHAKPSNSELPPNTQSSYSKLSSSPSSYPKLPSNESPIQNYPNQNLITSPSPSKPTNDFSLSDLIKSKIKEILSEDTQVETIFRKLKMINKIN